VHHKGNIANNVIDAAYQIVDGFEEVRGSVEEMKSTVLALPESRAFAEVALSLKYPLAAEGEDREAFVSTAPITPDQVLKARRYDDQKNDVWTVFNRVQENLTSCGFFVSRINNVLIFSMLKPPPHYHPSYRRRSKVTISSTSITPTMTAIAIIAMTSIDSSITHSPLLA
jgi:hypothetical protein